MKLFQKKSKDITCTVQIHHGCIACGACTKACKDIFILALKSKNGKQPIQVSQEKIEQLHQAEYRCPIAIIDVEELI